MKKLALAVSAALGMGLAASAQSAVPIPIDPDGAGGGGTVQVGNLDWAVGNALASGAGLGSDVGTVFTLYAQARLAGFNNIANDPILGTGLGSAFQWTYVTAFQEAVTTNLQGGRIKEFQVNPNNLALDSTSNFFRIYRDAALNADDLAGRGFNDGTLILEGHILIGNQVGDSNFTAAGNFNTTTGVFTPTLANLDQFGANNYDGGGGSDGHTSITGAGSSIITVQVDSFDSATFQNLQVGSLFTLDFNTSQILAYNQTNPSSCFWDGGAHIGGAGQTNPNQPAGLACANVIGAVNGISENNIIFQTDANNSFTATVIPEPGVLALLGISLLGLGIARSRKN
jgi:hypothetical protein